MKNTGIFQTLGEGRMRNIFSRNKALRSVFSGLARTAAVLGLAVAAMAAALLPGTAKAEWPERPITLVVMYGAGGGTDTIIRALATEMAKATGWTINVINKPGAVGGVATKYVLNKPADGYTLLGAANYNKFVRVMGHSESKAWEDWQYFQAANSVASWSVRPDSPYQTFEDAIAAARANPGKISISTSGTGGLWQELALIVSEAAGVKLKYVPYKGGKPATLAGLQGEVDIAGGGLHEHIEFIRAGKLRNLQHTAPESIDDAKGGHLRSVGDAPEIQAAHWRDLQWWRQAGHPGGDSREDREGVRRSRQFGFLQGAHDEEVLHPQYRDRCGGRSPGRHAGDDDGGDLLQHPGSDRQAGQEPRRVGAADAERLRCLVAARGIPAAHVIESSKHSLKRTTEWAARIRRPTPFPDFRGVPILQWRETTKIRPARTRGRGRRENSPVKRKWTRGPARGRI
jgi:tripartite-type tricarboxylate transporter receptor subunit TctC